MDAIVIFIAQYLIFIEALVAAIVLFKSEKESRIKVFLLLIITSAFSFVIAKIAGSIYYNPRPFVLNNSSPLFFHEATNGFPSNHSLLAFALALPILSFNRKVGLALSAFAILIGLSRIMSGVHHPADIFGSFLIVSFSYWFSYRYLLSTLIRSKLGTTIRSRI